MKLQWLLHGFAEDSFELVFARRVLAPELLHFYRQTAFFLEVAKICDFLKLVSRLQEHRTKNGELLPAWTMLLCAASGRAAPVHVPKDRFHAPTSPSR